ncbi:hypothetical protein MLD38_016195 [Melastoma candidum]|uniref:Uncharacterized protein n=1 Tax=Melastoma candidum TaxID=119954 RepID=A0ACB9RIP6_9MYRT|nr:hypothetical protein MLD38_016195 [Melastoma candidum]
MDLERQEHGEMKMMKKKKHHVLVVPYPSQGHINPMLQFSKRLSSKGLSPTLATTSFISSAMNLPSTTGPVRLSSISDGFDLGGFPSAPSIGAYLSSLHHSGSRTLAGLLAEFREAGDPVDCVVYDAFLPWVLDVAKVHGIPGAAFFTQACAVNYIYYLVHHGKMRLPLGDTPVRIPGLPPLELRDMPSFICVSGSYPAYFELVLHQFEGIERADWVLVNTFYELEAEVVDEMSKDCPVLTIGPTIPSVYLDKRVTDDKEYGLNLFELDPSDCIGWLQTKPPRSTVYVSFGSMAALNEAQMAEIAWGVKSTGFNFLWAVRTSEERKLPAKFKEEELGDTGLIVNWSPQMEILSDAAVGCFFTHSGWNSTIEALSVGVPMVGMPQWTDQPTDAKLVEDVWRVGLRVLVGEDGIVTREEIRRCIMQVMGNEEMRTNAAKWKELAVASVSPGGSSDRNIDLLVAGIAGP